MSKITKKETIKAIKDSIKHWEEDILKPLQEGDSIIFRCRDRIHIKYYWKKSRKVVRCYSKSCPLCSMFYNATLIKCFQCPLYRNNDKCGQMYSAWSLFIHYHDREAVLEMIEALKCCLKKELKND